MKFRIAFGNPNTYIVIFSDALLLCISYWMAFWLRYETLAGAPFELFQQTVLPVVLIKLVIFALFGLQSGMWRYTGVTDFINIIKASVISSAIIMIGMFFYYFPDFAGKFSRSVMIIDMIITVGLISLFRLSIRLYYSKNHDPASFVKSLFTSQQGVGNFVSDSGISVVIYGANDRGEHLLRSLESNPAESNIHYNVAGFIDEAPVYAGTSIHGYPVFSSLDTLEDLVARFGVQEMLVATRLEGDKLEHIYNMCNEQHIACRVIPGYFDEHHHKISASSLRNIQIEDLLYREPVCVDYTKIESALNERRVMITGAGGSIGAELSKQIAGFSPSRLTFVDISENNLHQLELDIGGPDNVLTRYICADVTDKEKMERVFAEHKPELVFHAAAYKHVPMMEKNKDEGIRNNIGGTQTMADLALRYNTLKFILISTDKAVNPVSVMGASKRVCELYMQYMADKGGTEYMAVRFGNVLGSNGSVVPTFMSQIERRGPVTITHPDIERYFMTIPEAVGLILQAGALGGQGDIFLLEMGEAVKIKDLAEKMIKMAGFEPERDISLVYTGLREGEKVTEELSSEREKLYPTEHPKVNKVICDDQPWIGVEQLMESALEQSRIDPELAAEHVISWIESSHKNQKINTS